MTAYPATGDDPESRIQPRHFSLLRTAAWWLSVIALGMIALAALDRTSVFIDPLWSGNLRPWGRLGLAFTGIYLLFCIGILLLAWRLALTLRLRGAVLPLVIVGVAIAVRVALAVVADAPIYGENRIIHTQALGVLDGSCCFSHRPMGYPLALAGAYALLGIGPTAVEALNLLFAAVTVWLVWDIGRVGWGRPVAAVAAAAFAVVPSQVFMVLVPLTEPMYTMAVAATVRLALDMGNRRMLTVGALAAMLAFGQYVRATAVSLLVPVLALPFLTGSRVRAAIARGLGIVAVFVVLMLPVAAYNLEQHGDLSVSTSAYAGWSFFVGANREHDGRWNTEDAARFAEFPGTTAWDKSEHAGTLVGARVAEDPEGALALLPRKFKVMWADETYAAAYALADGPATREIRVGWLTSQLFYAPLVLLAAIGMFVEGRTARPASLLIGMIVVIVVLTHMLLEVHSRYHAYLVPLLCVLAAVGVAALVTGFRNVRGRFSPA